MNRKNGFTLVEMLVAIVLLSLLIGVAVFAFRMQLINVKKLKSTGLDDVLHYVQLVTPIESMKYYVVEDYDVLGRPMKKMHYFFLGSSQSVRFITTNPNVSKADALVELSCADRNLIYKEEPLFGRINFLAPSFLEDSFQTILYQDLKECSFKYVNNNGETFTHMQDTIPSKIIVTLGKADKKETFFIQIKSDDNLTEARVYDAVYPAE